MGLNPIFEMIALNVARDLRRAGYPSQWPMFTGPNGKGLPRAYPSHGKQCAPASSRGAGVGMLENSRCRVHGAWSCAVLLRCLLDRAGILRYRDKIRMNFFFFFSSSFFFFVCVIKMASLAIESCFEMNFFYSGYQKTVFSEFRKNLQESWKERFTISDYLGLYHSFLIPLKIFPTSFPCFPRIDSLEKSSRDLTQVVSSILIYF